MKPQQEIKSKVTKSDIAKSFKEIEKFGGIVLNFGDNRRGRKAVTGKADCEIIYHSMFMIEIKVGKDIFSEKQITYGLKILNLLRVGLYYLIATEDNYSDVKDAILKQDHRALQNMEEYAKVVLVNDYMKLNKKSKLKRSKK